MNVSVLLEWDPPPGSGPEAIVDNYTISITPKPLSHPSLNVVLSTPLTVTLDYNIIYTAIIIATNCAGESSPFELTNIVYSKFIQFCGYLPNCEGTMH